MKLPFNDKIDSVVLRALLPSSKRVEWKTQRVERLLPPWMNISIDTKDRSLLPGSRRYFTLKRGFFRFEWIVEIIDLQSEGFVERQVEGPFSYWHHEHLFGNGWIEDRVEYRLPFLSRSMTKSSIEQAIRYTQRAIIADAICIEQFPSSAMRIVIAGASGVVGSALSLFLQSAGHKVLHLLRVTPKDPQDLFWDPEKGIIQQEKLENCDAVINLAGESIAARWTKKRKERLLSSRIESARLLSRSCGQLDYPPKVFINASAVGFYGSCNRSVDENSPKGTGFLSDLAKSWEEAVDFPHRTVFARFGMILSPKGGALQKMVTATTLGLAATLGEGGQIYSWIGIDDVVYHLYRCVMDARIEGAVNIVSESPVTNREFVYTLAKVLRRPNLLSLAAPLLRLSLGEMSDVLLTGAQVEPKKLNHLGYFSTYRSLEVCLRHLLGAM